MAARTIGTGVGTYRRAGDGAWTFGTLGEQVEVHDEDVERFDRLNPAPFVAPVAVDAVPVDEVVAPAPDAAAEVVVDVAKPARMGSKAAWVEYAIAQGMSQEEAEALTRDGLVEKFGG